MNLSMYDCNLSTTIRSEMPLVMFKLFIIIIKSLIQFLFLIIMLQILLLKIIVINMIYVLAGIIENLTFSNTAEYNANVNRTLHISYPDSLVNVSVAHRNFICEW